MVILSLFDSIGYMHLAVQKAGISIDRYLASEKYKQYCNISSTLFPDIEHVGDVSKLSKENLPDVDLLIVNDFLLPAKRKFDLFIEALRILRELKPKHFVFITPKTLKDRDMIRINQALGVDAVEMNDADYSPQYKKRIVWASFNIYQPLSLNDEFAKDIADAKPDPSLYLPEFDVMYNISTPRPMRIDENNVNIFIEHEPLLIEGGYDNLLTGMLDARGRQSGICYPERRRPIVVGKAYKPGKVYSDQASSIYSLDGKAIVPHTTFKGISGMTGMYFEAKDDKRRKDVVHYTARAFSYAECERAAGYPKGFISSTLPNKARKTLVMMGMPALGLLEHIFKCMAMQTKVDGR